MWHITVNDRFYLKIHTKWLLVIDDECVYFYGNGKYALLFDIIKHLRELQF